MPARANIYYPGEVLDVTEVILEWKDLANMTYHARPDSVASVKRSKGVHVSGIVKVIGEKRKLLSGDDETDDMPLVVLGGLAFEEQAARLYGDMIWQPGEISKDRIYGSPDGYSCAFIPELSIDNHCLDEFKRTYKSRRYREDIRAEQLWMIQVMSYLYMLGLNLVRLHVEWACDDYVMPFRPRYFRYLLRFTDQELKRNWDMMLKYKQFAKREG